MKEVADLNQFYRNLLAENTRPVAVILTGAGISAESGIPTFRDANGLWEGHDIYEVASPQGFAKNPQLVLDFYNLRREAAFNAEPNEGHGALVKLEEKYLVIVVTQNVDRLHEKAGSKHVLHLHGELSKVRSTVNEDYITDIGPGVINVGDLCPEGGQLRPHIVWFGEDVPFIFLANHLAAQADVFMIIGTSMQVYPAAGMIDYVKKGTPVFLIDRNLPYISGHSSVKFISIEKPASEGVPQAVEELLNNPDGTKGFNLF